MKPKIFFKKLDIVSIYLVLIILFLVPFHAFLSIYSSTIVGHYTLTRLWKEFLLAFLVIAGFVTLVYRKSITRTLAGTWLNRLILIYLAVLVIIGIGAIGFGSVSIKALFYGWLVDSRYLIFFLVTYALSLKYKKIKEMVPSIIFWPALIVVVFGLLEVFVLPRNFLTHFGYGPNTILPYGTINSNSKYVRIISFLRGPNPLGAYMVIPICLGTYWLIAQKNQQKILSLIFLIASVAVLYFSFSRSAWIGAAIGIAVVVWYSIKNVKIRRYLLVVGALLVLIGGILVVLDRHSTTIQNIFLHTQSHSKIKTTSDQGHIAALETGASQIASQPLGKGPGTSGPASVYNKYPARIPENYFIQIGQEVGWIGLALFLAINFFVLKELYLRRNDPDALVLLASFLGICFINLLAFAWADDTLSYLWWGMAGAVLAMPRPEKNN